MARRIAHMLSVAVVVATAAACTSAISRFYTLDSTATPDGTPRASYAVAVGPVSLPASVDRPQFVVQVEPNRVELDEFNRWAAPLDDGVARAVAGDLSVLLGTPQVAPAPLARFAADYRVTIDVLTFQSTPGKGVVVEALWIVGRTANGTTRSGRTVAREAVQGKDFAALAAAHSRALATLSADIAAAIRAEASMPPPPRRGTRKP